MFGVDKAQVRFFSLMYAALTVQLTLERIQTIHRQCISVVEYAPLPRKQ